jgi:hypothetical protein
MERLACATWITLARLDRFEGRALNLPASRYGCAGAYQDEGVC